MIANQIRDAKAAIEREVEEFNLRKEEHPTLYGHSRPPASRGEQSLAEDGADSSAAPPHPRPPPPPPPPTNTASTQAPRSGLDKNHHDEAGDEMVEGDEDIVIY